MQPQQPYQQPYQQPAPPYQAPTPPSPAAPPPGNYDFIMNPGKPPRKSLFSGGNSSPAVRLLLIVGAVAIIIFILGILLVILRGGSSNQSAMLSVLQDQDELTHLSTAGTQSSGTQTNKNVSATLSIVMPSEQTTLLNYLSQGGYKPNSKQLALKESAALDTQLQTAQSSSTFDTVYASALEQQLTTYMRDLNTAYKDAGNQTRQVIKARYDNAQLLLTQLKGTD